MDRKEKNIVNQVSAVSIVGNIMLSLFKMIAGLIGHSGAMISDAVHSLSDVFATVIAFIGVKMSKKGADTDHPYGHEKIECISAEILGGLLLITGGGIGFAGLRQIFSSEYKNLPLPGLLPLAAAIVSIVVKEGMFWYTRACAKKIHSSVFMADAWHHRSDALSSVGSLLGIAGARAGLPILDPIASVIICLFILKVAFDILTDAIRKLTDTACDDRFNEELKAYIQSFSEVKRIDVMRTRLFGERAYVDIELSMDAQKTLEEAHTAAEEIHDGLEKEFPLIKHVMIHVNPYKTV